MKQWSIFAVVLLLHILPVSAQDTKIHYLSGIDKDDTVDWAFYCTDGRNSGRWTTIPVPSQWELQGFGTYNYGREQSKSDERGEYRYDFEVPAAWRGQNVTLVFEGVMTDTEVWINGKSAGPMHQGGFYEFSYDVTGILRYGNTNRLEVTVHKVSHDASVELAERLGDYWVFGGIFRPVFLKISPAEFITRTAIDARSDGAFTIDCYLQNVTDVDRITAQIFTLDGVALGNPMSASVTAGQTQLQLAAHTENPETWTAETPHLYRVTVTLWHGNDPVHRITEKFGFRSVEIRPGDGIYINNQRVLLKGVNRHSFWPESGRTTSRALSIADVLLMKDMNMNAVRMSHYPPDRHFLEVCDSLGLYVLDELAGWQYPPYDTGIGKKLVKELVVRDVNHPAIIFWDNGNEGGNNWDLDGEFGRWDPQNRPVLHPWGRHGGLETDHYRSWDVLNRILREHVYLPTEFLHGMYDGGHGAGLKDSWDIMRTSPRGGGAFLWVFADEGVLRTDKDGLIDVAGNQAPDGIVGPYHEKEGSYFTVKEIWSPVMIDLENTPEGLAGAIPVENRYDFTNLQKCRIEWKLVDFPPPHSAETDNQVRASGTLPGPAIAPHASGFLHLGLPENYTDYDALLVSVYDSQDRRLWTWSKALRGHAAVRKQVVHFVTEEKSVQENETHITVRTGDMTLTFEKRYGRLTGVRRQGQDFSFGNGPATVVGRGRSAEVTHYADGDDYVVEATGRGGNLERITWRISGSGWVEMAYRYYLTGPQDFTGLTFEYPEEKVRGVRWLGEGPYRVWQNRMQGTTLGVWENPYKNNIPGKTWDYPRFKGYFADMRWMRLDTEEGPITVVSDDPGLFLRLYTPAKAGGNLDRFTAPPFPRGDISFLHGIPLIGTKFASAQQRGPQGWPYMAQGLYEGKLFFLFGEIPENPGSMDTQ